MATKKNLLSASLGSTTLPNLDHLPGATTQRIEWLNSLAFWSSSDWIQHWFQ